MIINWIAEQFARGTMEGLLSISVVLCAILIACAVVVATGVLAVYYVTDGQTNYAPKLLRIAEYNWQNNRLDCIMNRVVGAAWALLGLCVVGFPLALYLIFYIPWLLVAVVSLYATLRIARAVLRLKNKLSSHMADLNAHNMGRI